MSKNDRLLISEIQLQYTCFVKTSQFVEQFKENSENFRVKNLTNIFF